MGQHLIIRGTSTSRMIKAKMKARMADTMYELMILRVPKTTRKIMERRAHHCA